MLTVAAALTVVMPIAAHANTRAGDNQTQYSLPVSFQTVLLVDKEEDDDRRFLWLLFGGGAALGLLLLLSGGSSHSHGGHYQSNGAN
jgi:hypothetical protein